MRRKPASAVHGRHFEAEILVVCVRWYLRIQGPALVIEYAPQPLGGDPTMHIHTIYRDPTNDYGKKLTSK